MTKREADAINRSRAQDPLGQPDYKQLWVAIQERRQSLTARLRLHHWLDDWQTAWRCSQERLETTRRESPGWYSAAMECLDLLQKLVQVRQEQSARPDEFVEKDIPHVLNHRPKDVERILSAVVVLHLRGDDDSPKAGQSSLNLLLGTDHPFPDPPWSRNALRRLCKAAGWGEHLVGDLAKRGRTDVLLPGIGAEFMLPDATVFARFLASVLTLGQRVPAAAGLHDPFILNVQTAAMLLHAIDDASLAAVRAAGNASVTLRYLEHAALDAMRIGQRLDREAFLKPRFPLTVHDRMVDAWLATALPPSAPGTGTVPVVAEAPDETASPGR